MDVKNKFNLTLLISSIFSIISSIFYIFVVILIVALLGGVTDIFSDLSLWYEYFFFYVICILLFLVIIYPILKIYVLVQYHYNNIFCKNLSLVIIILSLINIPFGTIFGILLLIFRVDILKDLNKSSSKKKKVISKK